MPNPNDRIAAAVAFAREHRGRRVMWSLYRDRELVVSGTTSSNYVILIYEDDPIGSASMLPHGGYAAIHEITLVEPTHGAKWQRLGVTKGLEKLERTREEVLRAV